MTTPQTPQQDPLVPMRLALIMLAMIIVGAMIGTLTFFATDSVSQAILAGLIAAGAAVLPLDRLIGN